MSSVFSKRNFIIKVVKKYAVVNLRHKLRAYYLGNYRYGLGFISEEVITEA